MRRFFNAIIGLAIWAALIFYGWHYWKERNKSPAAPSTTVARATEQRAMKPLVDVMSPEGKAAMERGMIAVQSQQWSIALESFETARQHAPASPPVLFNLALAHAKAGQDLRAIAWFHAFISAAPDDPKVPQVREQITTLNRKLEVKLLEIASALQQVADQLPTLIESPGLAKGVLPQSTEGKYARVTHYGDVAAMQAAAGDVHLARQTILKAEWLADEARAKVSAMLARAGNFDGAGEIAEQIGRDDVHDNAVSEIRFHAMNQEQWERAADLALRMRDQAKGNDLEAQTASSMPDKALAVRTLRRAVQRALSTGKGGAMAVTALAWKGESDEAIEALNRLPLKDDNAAREFSSTRVAIARVLSEEKQFDRAESLARTIPPNSFQCRALSAIAEDAAKAGQRDRAAKLLDEAAALAVRLIKTGGQNGARYELTDELYAIMNGVVYADVNAGRLEEALSLMEQIPHLDFRKQAAETVMDGLARAGAWTRAMAIADGMPDDQRAQRLHRVLANYAQSDKPNEMLQALKHCEVAFAQSPGTEAAAQQWVVKGLARAGMPDEVMRQVNQQTSDDYKVSLLSTAATACLDGRDSSGAKRFIDAALKLSADATQPLFRTNELAFAMAAADDVDGARQLLERSYKDGALDQQLGYLAAAVFKSKPSKTAELLARVTGFGQADIYAECGDLEKALWLTARVPDIRSRESLYMRIGDIMRNRGEDAAAESRRRRLSRECSGFSPVYFQDAEWHKDLNGYIASLKSKPAAEVATSLSKIGTELSQRLVYMRWLDAERTRQQSLGK